MAASDVPMTTAVRALRAAGVAFTPHLYRFEEHGGTRHSAEALGVAEHAVVKTLVVKTEPRSIVLVLMHGDAEVSMKELARTLGVRSVEPCDAPTAERQTGYQFGGTSPFGTRHPLPVYAERTIFQLPTVYINGGKRGFLVELSPTDLKRALTVSEVDVAQSRPSASSEGTVPNEF